MKLAVSRKVPENYRRGQIEEIVREIETAVNLTSEEKLAGHHGAMTAAPTTGDWKRGDFVRNSEPSEAGSASSKYVILGWVCTASGTPGTWLQCRVLTGN